MKHPLLIETEKFIGMGAALAIRDLAPEEVAQRLKDDAIVLIDVREPAEYAAERIHGALLFPLSTFDPHALPDSGKRRIVFHCGSGARSAQAVAQCQGAGFGHDCHLKGGLKAWKAVGFPTISIDAATGQMRDQR